MANRDKDIFQRLRQVGLRKESARALSELGDGTSKRAVRAARTVVSELRALADELERRLPDTPSEPAPASSTKRSTATSRPRVAPARRTRAPRAASPAKTPRGENKAKILAALSSGPKTASQVAADTGIKTGTASTTLTKMLASGEVIKAARGYGLPPATNAA